MANAGYTNSTFLAENIYAYADAVFDAEAAFVIDWGNNPPTGVQNPAGHRGNLLDPDLREVGIGLVNAPERLAHGASLGHPGLRQSHHHHQSLVLGNVYSDNNLDGFYEPGEGMSGVTLTFIGGPGTFQTTTTAAGGYQLQVPAGTYRCRQRRRAGRTNSSDLHGRSGQPASRFHQADFARPHLHRPGRFHDQQYSDVFLDRH